MDAAGVPGLDAAQRAELAEANAAEPFERVTRLAAMDLGTPLAAVRITGEFACFAGDSPCAPDMADWQTRAERASESVSRLADGPRRPESFPYDPQTCGACEPGATACSTRLMDVER
jgi:hypothetical protein